MNTLDQGLFRCAKVLDMQSSEYCMNTCIPGGKSKNWKLCSSCTLSFTPPVFTSPVLKHCFKYSKMYIIIAQPNIVLQYQVHEGGSWMDVQAYCIEMDLIWISMSRVHLNHTHLVLGPVLQYTTHLYRQTRIFGHNEICFFKAENDRLISDCYNHYVATRIASCPA